MVLTTLQSGTKLSRRDEQVDVVRTNEVLRHSDNGPLQGGFTMVIGTVFSNISGELSNLDVRPKISFKGRIEDLPLARFQAIHKLGRG